MAYCQKCKKKIPEDSEYCQKCGAEQVKEGSEQKGEITVAREGEYKKTPKWVYISWMFLATVWGILLLMGVFDPNSFGKDPFGFFGLFTVFPYAFFGGIVLLAKRYEKRSLVLAISGVLAFLALFLLDYFNTYVWVYAVYWLFVMGWSLYHLTEKR